MLIRTLLSALALSSTAVAQSINIDFGEEFSNFLTPGPTYGAAANTPGTWNAIDPTAQAAATFTSGPLLDLDGTQTAVTIDFVSTSGNNYFEFEFNEPSTFGEDEALMDDIMWTLGSHTMTIHGLADGTYTLYTYAMAPDEATGRTTVNVVGSADPAATVGGSFSGGFVRNVTHAQHVVTVSGGNSIVVEVDFLSWSDSLNGLQIVGAGDIGSSYCSVVPNSTGAAADLTGFGNLAATANDVTLTTTGLPENAFAFFLVSLDQGFIQNPGGSQGNLCLGGSIGRYVGPGQIQNSGAAGAISFALDLAQTPTPTGFVSIQPGETWNYQAWYRDVVGGTAISNLSNGLSLTYQ
ncbi:MAG: hypothetical protein AAGB93_06540 [Planctomycetota bacterium]